MGVIVVGLQQKQKRAVVSMNHETGDASLTLKPGWTGAELVEARTLLEDAGWEELTVLESGSLPEELEDGTLIIPFVRAALE